jgi:SNF2 family DNA or RNA helicase
MPSKTVSIEREGNRIFADIPYHCKDQGDGPMLAKMISGVRPKYDRGAGPGGKDKFICWTYPLDLSVCRELRAVFGKALQIGPELAAWAMAERRREAELREIQGGGLVKLDRVGQLAPVLYAALQNRPYQPIGASYMAAGQRVMLADDTGLGKTPQTLAALVQAGARRVLVFCKKSAMNSVWHDESLRWLGDLARVFVVTGTHSQREEILGDSLICYSVPGDRPSDEITFVVCNVEMVRAKKDPREKANGDIVNKIVPDYPQLFDGPPWDAVIFDESHRALVGKSDKSKTVSQTRLGAMKLPVREDGMKIALSATPFRGKVVQAWGTLNWLRPEVFTSFWRFAGQWFGTEENEYGGMIVSGEDVLPDKRAEFDRMLAPYILRRTKAEVASDLPPKQYAGTPLKPDDPGSPVGIWLDMDPRQKKAYDGIEKDSIAQIEGGTLTPNGHLAQWMRLKQFATAFGRMTGGGRREFTPALPSNKFEWLLDHLDEYDGKILVFSQFTKVVNLFAYHLQQEGHKCRVLTGETKQADRDDIVRGFQQDGVGLRGRILLLNTLAGGESITLDAADEAVFLDETWIPDEQEQAEGRIHRVSRIHQVTYYYLRSRGTIEEDIARTTLGREYRTKAALDGPRGISFSKQLAEAARSRTA